MQTLKNFLFCVKIDYQKELKEIRNVENQKLEILRHKHKHTYFRMILSVHPLLKLEDMLAKYKKHLCRFSIDANKYIER